MALTISKFLGLHNTTDPKAMPAGALTTANNIDILREGFVKRRNGYAKSLSCTSITSSYVTKDASRLFIVDSGNLKLVNADLTVRTLATGFPSTRLYWDDASGYTFISNAKVIYPDNSVHDLNIPDPVQPNTTITTGNLSAGRYQVAITYMNSNGREGSVSLPFVREVTDDAGIVVEPEFISGYSCNIYVSAADGDLLYRAINISQGSYLISDVSRLSEPIDDKQIGTTQPPDNIEHLCYFEGKLYVTTSYQGHSFVWFSQDYWWNLFDSQKDYFTLVGKITCLKATIHGLVIGTDHELWLFKEDTLTKLADYGVPEGLAVVTDSVGNVLIWTKRGVCTLPFSNITETKVSLITGSHVSSAIINDAGQKRFIVLSDDQGSAYNAF